MILLDLFCGAGGAAAGYARAGFEVVGVDIEPQPNYPHRFMRADAVKVLAGLDYDAVAAIHASPPCQSFTAWPCVAPPCNHAWQTPRFPPATNRSNLRRTVEVGAYRCHKLAPAAMGIDWMTNDELSEAIPPAYTEWIGRQLAAYLKARTA